MIKYVEISIKGALKNYIFKTDLDLKEGDIVVCDTAFGFTVGNVRRITAKKPTSFEVTKWIVEKINVEMYNKKIYFLNRMEMLLNQMENRKDELTEYIYSELAKSDDKMKNLYDEYVNVNAILKIGE